MIAVQGHEEVCDALVGIKPLNIQRPRPTIKNPQFSFSASTPKKI
jgi:hypothetical protein